MLARPHGAAHHVHGEAAKEAHDETRSQTAAPPRIHPHPRRPRSGERGRWAENAVEGPVVPGLRVVRVQPRLLRSPGDLPGLFLLAPARRRLRRARTRTM